MLTAELLTPGELAQRLKVTRATVTRWRRAGRIPAIRINQAVYRFDYENVLNTLRGLPAAGTVRP